VWESIFHRLVAELSCRGKPISNKPSLNWQSSLFFFFCFADLILKYLY
jgi:hypothetical protein